MKQWDTVVVAGKGFATRLRRMVTKFRDAISVKIRFRIGMYSRPVPGRVVPILRDNWVVLTKLWQPQERFRRRRRASKPASSLNYWLMSIVISLHTPPTSSFCELVTDATSALRPANEIFYQIMDNERREPERVAIQRISVSIDFELSRKLIKIKKRETIKVKCRAEKNSHLGFGLDQDQIANFVISALCDL